MTDVSAVEALKHIVSIRRGERGSWPSPVRASEQAVKQAACRCFVPQLDHINSACSGTFVAQLDGHACLPNTLHAICKYHCGNENRLLLRLCLDDQLFLVRWLLFVQFQFRRAEAFPLLVLLLVVATAGQTFEQPVFPQVCWKS